MMAAQHKTEATTLDFIKRELEHDERVKVAGVDLDGILRGKVMAKSKFLSIAEEGFGFCSVIFGWDMHDKTYPEELSVSNAANGYRDIVAVPDLSTYRRIPWEDNIPFFLLSFRNPLERTPLAVDPRSLLKKVTDELASYGWEAMCGAEFEFFNFKVLPSGDSEFEFSFMNNTVLAVSVKPMDDVVDTNWRILRTRMEGGGRVKVGLGGDRAGTKFYEKTPDSAAEKGHVNLKALTPGMFGYSLLRPTVNQDYFYDLFDECAKFGVHLEGLHTETGPGVYEAALAYDTATKMADMANLFKLAVKQLGLKRGIMPTFMAKPYGDQPGCSGHLHFSIRDINTKANLFAAGSDGDREKSNVREEWEASAPGTENMSQLMRWFVAGLLTGLPSIMCILAPNINSYKRLVENYWAPVTISWGVESRVSAIRIIGPPQCPPKGTRLEMRVSGADINSHLAIAACLACGLYGIKNKLAMPVPPTTHEQESNVVNSKGKITAERLPKSLKDSAQAMLAPNSIARQVLGDEFVDHYGATRMYEYRAWETAVTSWEHARYFELV
ncbi:hypothetical protein BGW41_007802 [Actinomortierella wolfii]|nr:hypothetical protein BGW41_007802 [Actinomortierella wolfii]